MGLDMYVEGKKFLTSFSGPERPIEDGYPVQERVLEMAYWRKHPDLHGFIVQEFADGEDNCQPIELGPDAIDKIIAALEANALPKTSGFFFGDSERLGDLTPERRAEDAETWRGIKAWLETEEAGVWKSVRYEASW